MKRLGIGIAILVVAALLGGYFIHRHRESAADAKKRQGMPPAPVTTQAISRKTVTLKLDAIGTVEAYSTVTVKSRIDGQILKAGFRQGQMVRRGELLFDLDPKPFQAQLDQAQAVLARDQAQFENARLQTRRDADLVQKGFIAQAKYDTDKATADALGASVDADQAAVQLARLQLGYTRIRSPIDGLAGSILIYPGNLVKNNDTTLVVINQVQPIYVTFSVPQENLPQIQHELASGTVNVEARPAGDAAKPIVGHLSFVNNAVDATTGTIQLKATFANDGRSMTPGQFVNVALALKQLPNALVVPTQAIQRGPKGSYVYVVKPDKTVEVRYVTAQASAGGDTVIDGGLQPGEEVVTDGQLRLYPGARVTPDKASSATDANR